MAFPASLRGPDRRRLGQGHTAGLRSFRSKEPRRWTIGLPSARLIPCLWALVHLHVSSENVVPSPLPHILLALLYSPATSAPNHKCLNICLPPLGGILLGPPSPWATFLCAGSQWPHTGKPGVAKAGQGCPPPHQVGP